MMLLGRIFLNKFLGSYLILDIVDSKIEEGVIYD